jgi:hypothetical protein
MPAAGVNESDAYCNLLNLASLYTDIATFDFHEVQMYAGDNSYNLYAKAVRKAGWTARGVAPMLRVAQGAFGETQQHEVLRSADYWGFTWVHWKTPEIETVAGYQARWTPKLGFYIIDNVEVAANELPLCHIYPEAMDFESELLVEEGKYDGLMEMIGWRPELSDPYQSDLPLTANGNRTLPSVWVMTPLSAWFTKKHNDHLPIAALAFNTVLFKVTTRQLNEVLNIDKLENRGTVAAPDWRVKSFEPMLIPSQHLVGGPMLTMVKVHSYGMVVQMPNRDRKVLAKTPQINLLIQQHQRALGQQMGLRNVMESLPIDMRFVYPVRALMFGLRNTTRPAEWGNWSSHSTQVRADGRGVDFAPKGQVNPISAVNIRYDNQTRVGFTSYLFDRLMPYLCATRVPKSVGYNLWSYSADLNSNQPDGSVNFSRVSQPSIICHYDPAVHERDETFHLHILAINWNHLKITLGTSSFSAN